MTDIVLPRPAAGPFFRFVADAALSLDAPPRFLELLPIAIYACDRDGRILWFNQKAVELWGRAPAIRDERELYCGFHKAYFGQLEITPGRTQMAKVLRTGHPVHGIEGVLERPDGSRIWVMMHIDPVHAEGGQLVGAINCFHDITASKRGEQTLREHEQRLAATYEHAEIGITEADANGIRLRVNMAACNIMGRTREQMLGKCLFDAAHPEDRDDDIEQHRRLAAGAIDRYSVEKRYFTPDGRLKWLAIACSAVRDETGKFLYSVRVFHDITEIKRTIAELAESQQRLAATYEHAAIAISEVDADGRLRRVNETVCAITGYTREELLELSVFDVTHPDDREDDRESYRSQTSREAVPYAVEKRLICKDGRVIWVSVASSSVTDPAGRFLYGIRVMQDITARKHAEAQVRESEQQLRQLLEALPAAVYTTDSRGRIAFFNQAAVALSGRVPELNSDEWCVTWKLFHTDGRPMPHDQCPMAVALKEDRPIREQEAVAQRPDGTLVPFMPYPTPIHDSSGTLVGAVNMLVDITDRKRAEDRQRVLIDELNHRVKNTLATVQSLASQTLRGSGKAADIFLSRLFALSRTHDQLSRAGWESADFQTIVDDIFAPYQLDGSERLVCSGGPVRLPPQKAVLLAMVMHELATNAAKYGSLSVPDGKLNLTWTTLNGAGERRLLIDWRESGGPPVRKPKRQGFGSRLADRAITRELNGEAQFLFAAEGLHCNFAIPLQTPRYAKPS